MREEKNIFEESKVENIVCLSQFKNVFYYTKSLLTFKKKKEENKERVAIEKLRLISKDNKELMEVKYGKQTFCIKDSANRRLYVWKHIVNEYVTLWVITAPERGTSIEFENKSKNNFGEEIISKIEDIFDLKDVKIE